MPHVDTENAKARTNDYLAKLFESRIHRAREIGERYELFWQHIREVVLTGGKRIRPYLTMIGYGAADEKILPIAAAQELIHTAMLMHDDVIDQDDVRHGVKNMNGIYNEAYKSYIAPLYVRHYGNSAAMLAGDVIISEAYRAILDSSFSDAVKRRAAEQMHTSIYEVVGGELLDVEAAFVSDATFDPLQIYRYKTASYSFIGPLLSGAYCAGADDETIDALRHFGAAIGIAYQIQDDLLGVFGDEAVTGKSTLTDLREGKYTLLVHHHQSLMNNEMRLRFEAFGSDQADTDQLVAIRQDMIDSGARQKTTNEVATYVQRARTELNRLPDGERRRALVELVENVIIERES